MHIIMNTFARAAPVQADRIGTGGKRGRKQEPPSKPEAGQETGSAQQQEPGSRLAMANKNAVGTGSPETLPTCPEPRSPGRIHRAGRPATAQIREAWTPASDQGSLDARRRPCPCSDCVATQQLIRTTTYSVQFSATLPRKAPEPRTHPGQTPRRLTDPESPEEPDPPTAGRLDGQGPKIKYLLFHRLIYNNGYPYMSIYNFCSRLLFPFSPLFPPRSLLFL